MLKAEKILKEENISYKLIQLEKESISTKDVVKHGNVNEDEICKTIIVKDKKRNFYACVLKGNNMIDKNKVKNIVKSKITIATHDNVREVAKVNPGEVCPLLLNIKIIVDKNVLNSEKINFGSGNLLFGIEMILNDFLKMMKNYEISDITADQSS